MCCAPPTSPIQNDASRRWCLQYLVLRVTSSRRLRRVSVQLVVIPVHMLEAQLGAVVLFVTLSALVRVAACCHF